MTLEKAKLIELKEDFTDEKPGGKTTIVQFNPETLKVTYANQLVEPKGGDQSSGNAGRQFVGAGTTKLALQLWFDVNALEDRSVDDVRRLTKEVIFFMTPKPTKDPKRQAAPAVRFVWGSFHFDGLVDALEETLEYFSPEGKPLRASISLGLSRQQILESKRKPGSVPTRPGEQPVTPARQGDSVQNLADKNGDQDWQSIARANGIEDPLRLPPGQLVNLNVKVGGQIGVNAGVGISVGAAASVSTNLNSSLGRASGSFSVT